MQNTSLLKRPVPCLILIFLIAFISSCRQDRQPWQWGHADIDTAIDKNTAYRQLDKEQEVFSMHEYRDTTIKRTSGVAYFTKAHVNIKDSNSARLNNCRAWLHGDTLSISIGIGNGFGGWGFMINYKDKQFCTRPYYFTDVITDEPEPIYELVYQELLLDKPAYKTGDSLYGKIDFKIVEIGPDKARMEHTGQGYFRAIIKNR